MYENSPVAYLALDESDRCLDLNSELCELLEYSPEELIGKSFFELCAPQMRHLYPEQFAEFRGKQRLQTELELMRKDNALLTVFVEGRLQCDIAGKFLRMHCLLNDITERKRAEVVLRKAHEELEGRVAERTLELTAKTQHLEEVNTALKVLLKQRAEDRGEIEEAIMGNVKNLILPYLEKLKRSRLDNNQETYVAILEAHINEITSTFVRKLSVQHLNLTPTEIQIAALVKEGKTTKEIARILCISEKAISFHRNNIRRKLGLNKRRTNLISYLASLP
jgi:PAS domain S-box-containing protein